MNHDIVSKLLRQVIYTSYSGFLCKVVVFPFSPAYLHKHILYLQVLCEVSSSVILSCRVILQPKMLLQRNLTELPCSTSLRPCSILYRCLCPSMVLTRYQCWLVYLLSHLIRDTLSSHTALSQRHRVSEKACCNVKRKLTFVEFTQTDQEWRKKKRVRMRRGGGGQKGEKDDFLSWQPVNRLMGVRFAMS